MVNDFKKIETIISSYDNFIIMAHKGMDLDAYASCLVMYQILKSKNKNAYVYMSKELENKSVEKSVQKVEENGIKIDYQYEEKAIKNVLVIILDTHKKELIENYLYIENYPNIIIDHHVKNYESIKSEYTYINEEMSSVSEIMVNYIKYLSLKIDPIIATILLGGMDVDTNSFNIKTTAETFEAAAFLLKSGANIMEKKKILKEDKENYCKRQDFVKQSTMINKNMALCEMDDNIYKRHILALISEDLLSFDDVEASFTIGYTDDKTVSISSRSIGSIDVEKIMFELGGGGHKTDAACEIKNTTISDVKRKLLSIIGV